jgi:hypothetical protein
MEYCTFVERVEESGMVIVSGKLKPRRIQIFAIAAIFLLSMPMLMIIQPFNEISKVPFSHAEPLSWNTNNANDEPSDTFTLAASNDSDWIEIDPIADSGTPAISEVSDLDTTGMTVTSYFYGFWRGNVTLNGVIYDTINMPGASSVVAHDRNFANPATSTPKKGDKIASSSVGLLNIEGWWYLNFRTCQAVGAGLICEWARSFNADAAKFVSDYPFANPQEEEKAREKFRSDFQDFLKTKANWWEQAFVGIAAGDIGPWPKPPPSGS